MDIFLLFREEGWWYGEKLDGSGKKGFFPQNHVQLAKGLAKEIDPNDIQFTGLLGAGGFSVVKSAIYKRRVRFFMLNIEFLFLR